MLYNVMSNKFFYFYKDKKINKIEIKIRVKQNE